MKENRPSSLISAMMNASGKLVAFIVISIMILLMVENITAPTIAKAERQNLLDNFNQVLPQSEYNNDLLESTTLITDPSYLKRLGSDQPVTVYRAYQNQKPVGAIFTSIAPDGYSGKISILVGVYANGQISGVRVLKHRETPGLGDKIEIEKSNWILDFNQRHLTADNASSWNVKKDGGEFDQFTGATITPRAVIKSVKNSLAVINDIGAQLYE